MSKNSNRRPVPACTHKSGTQVLYVCIPCLHMLFMCAQLGTVWIQTLSSTSLLLHNSSDEENKMRIETKTAKGAKANEHALVVHDLLVSQNCPVHCERHPPPAG